MNMKERKNEWSVFNDTTAQKDMGSLMSNKVH